MKSDMFQSISFEQANEIISKADINELLYGNPQAKFSMRLKKTLFLITGLAMPVTMFISYTQGHNNIPETIGSRAAAITVSLLFILEIVYFYFKKTSNFENVRYHSFLYISLKTLYLSYICGSIGRFDEEYVITIFTLAIFVPTCLVLYQQVEKNMIIEKFNSMFKTTYTTSKILSILVKLAGLVLILGILSAQLYRLNKWWLMETGLERFEMSEINSGLLISAGIIVTLIIALIPTYLCFDAQLFLKNRLVELYSEEFRIEYGFTKKEWYNE